MKKIAMILSGCGHRDGSEITEAVSLLIALSAYGAKVSCFAPKMEFEVKDALGGVSTSGMRNVLTESARIARGEISDLKNLNPADFDGVVFPGGFGAALNLSDWAANGANCEIHPDVRRIIVDFHAQSKPIGAVCIAPALVARVLGGQEIELTIGNDPDTIVEIKKTGAQHVECPVDDYVTDRLAKVITTPAYMYEASPHEVFKGISGLVKELVEMA